MGNGLRIGSIAGIAIHLDWSLAVIFLLVASGLAMGLFPAWHPDWSTALAWTTAIAAAVLFFASVLVHELSHALVGRRHGMRIERITLFIFGGMAHLEREPHGWKGELKMAIVGPITSLAIGIAALLLVGVSGDAVELDPERPEAFLASLGPLPSLLLWLGQVNLLLAIFNLVPGFPLDGGRVLRAILWGATGNLRQATRWAAAAGQAFGLFLIALGIGIALGLRVPVFGSGLTAGLWLMLIGWFLSRAALVSYRQLLLHEALADVRVARVMRPTPPAVPPGLSVAGFIDDHLMASDERAFPVAEGERLLGIVCLADVQRLGREAHATATVREIMTPLERLSTTHPDEDVVDALTRLAEKGVNQLPVMQDGRLAGFLRREDILKWIAVHGGRELGPGTPPA